MTEVLTAAQMRAAEEAAFAAGEVSGLELMERAGRGVVEALLDWRPDLAAAPHRAVVLCGPGNNGGDGFAVARLLHARGWQVEVWLYGDEAKLPPDAAENARRWRNAGGEVVPYQGQMAAELRGGVDVLVDALFGVGLTRPVEGFNRLFAASRAARAGEPDWPAFVSVDIPSGLCADSGRPLAEAETTPDAPGSLFAQLTVTFHRAKRGHYLGVGFTRCGALAVADIGLRGKDTGAVPLADRALAEVLGVRTRLGKTEGRHKYDYGHALVLAGGVGTGGAGRLAARGALRVGAGAVTVGVPPAAILENAAQLDAIMLRPVRDLGAFLADGPAKMNALCLGPGLGRGEATRATVAAACRSGRGVVLDADALTSFENAPEELFALLHEGCVLTPHPGEFGRVFPDLRGRMPGPASRGPAYSKLDATCAAAVRSGAVVLLKGTDTVIATPDGRAAISCSAYHRSAPWLATAGSGDVLAGFIAGLLARDFGPFEAAATAAWLHVEAARAFGPGLIAEDLPEALPAVFRDLGV